MVGNGYRIPRGRCAGVGSAETRSACSTQGWVTAGRLQGWEPESSEHPGWGWRVNILDKNAWGVCSHRTQKSLVDLIHSVGTNPTGPTVWPKPTWAPQEKGVLCCAILEASGRGHLSTEGPRSAASRRKDRKQHQTMLHLCLLLVAWKRVVFTSLSSGNSETSSPEA